MFRRLWTLSALFVVIALVMAACGPATSSEAPAAEAPVVAEETAPTAAPVEEAPAEEAPVAEVAAAATELPAEKAPAATARTFVIDPAQSEVSYFVEEEFFGAAVPFVTAVGKTSAITGSIGLLVNGSSVQIAENEFTVDLRTLTSDQARRDRAIRRDWLQSETYPFASFKASEVANLPADAALGQDVSFQLVGDITVREITQPITWDVTARLDGSSLSGTATANLLMVDFGFDPPNIANMLKVTDGVTLTLNFGASEAAE